MVLLVNDIGTVNILQVSLNHFGVRNIVLYNECRNRLKTMALNIQP